MSAPSYSTSSQHPHHPPPVPFYNPQEQSNHENDQERTNYIINTFLKNFGDGMRENPKGWRGRFRKMAADEFAFYRGSAVLFYRDLHRTLSHDPWLKNCPKASSIFIHVSNQRKFHFQTKFFFRVIFMQKILVHILIALVSLISMSMISMKYKIQLLKKEIFWFYSSGLYWSIYMGYKTFSC
jgi:hypothetical protein